MRAKNGDQTHGSWVETWSKEEKGRRHWKQFCC
jgi:hypothetical protein